MAKSGGAGKMGLILLLVMAGGMGWNYNRNADAEAETQGLRPYRTYSDAELQQLKAAQQSEADRHDANYRSGARKVTVRDGAALSDRVAEFERIQKISARHRARGQQASGSRAAISLIESEETLRERDRPIYKMILRRTFTLPPI